MASRNFFAVVLILAAGLGTAAAQLPRPLPGRGPAPLLYVRLSGPPGTHAAFFQGRASARGFHAPVTVGLRPGYIYRVELTGLEGRPGISLAPSLEVRNTLTLPPGLNAATYPAPVEFTDADIEQALA